MHPEVVPVFFYGGLINPKVQEKVGLSATGSGRAVLHGYALTFEPWVNLRTSQADHVHGLVIEATHAMLDRVYSQLAARYLPYPVLCATQNGARSALCFIAPAMTPGPIDGEHVENLADAAESCGFPADYVAMIRSFRG